VKEMYWLLLNALHVSPVVAVRPTEIFSIAVYQRLLSATLPSVRYSSKRVILFSDALTAAEPIKAANLIVSLSAAGNDLFEVEPKIFSDACTEPSGNHGSQW
jgi:hypothetical protein